MSNTMVASIKVLLTITLVLVAMVTVTTAMAIDIEFDQVSQVDTLELDNKTEVSEEFLTELKVWILIIERRAKLMGRPKFG